MIDKIKNSIEKHNLINTGDHVVVGVSGGPDSVCLLHVLFMMKDELQIQLSVVHVNHMLRGQDADNDEKYVKNLCENLNIPCFVYKTDVKKISKSLGLSDEEAGRKVRYDAYFEVLEKIGAHKIAVAQNMNDQAETLLFRLARGSGLDGLSGMEYVRNQIIIRPLLDITRDEIEDYCRQFNLNPRIDKTNYESLYTRNKIRLELIPYLKQNLNQNIIYNLWKTADILKEDKNFIYTVVYDVYEKCVSSSGGKVFINKRDLAKQHNAIKKRILLKAAISLGVQKDIGTVHLNNILKLIEDDKTSAGIDLPYNLRVEIDYENIILTRGADETPIKMFSYDMEWGKYIYIKEIEAFISAEIIGSDGEFEIIKDDYIKFFDFDKIRNPLKIRNRKSGDVFSPLGMEGSKKLKEFFIDEKIPKDLRGKIPLVCCGPDVLWVIGYRISEKYKIDKTTKKILKLEFKECRDGDFDLI